VSTNQFAHRANWDGTFDSICRVCFVTVGQAKCESDLDKAQEDHRCEPWLLQLYGHPKGSDSDEDEAVRPPQQRNSPRFRLADKYVQRRGRIM
jgi:hypothetical protein